MDSNQNSLLMYSNHTEEENPDYNPFPYQNNTITNFNPNMTNYGDDMFNTMGMKGNIHSALFNSFPKQLTFSDNCFAVQDPKVGLDSFPSPPYVGFRPEVPANFKPSTSRTIYSSSGFDLLQILSYLANRPNPTINIGPVDLSCAFLLVDAKKLDFPIVYSSPAFRTLTGYDTHEVVGRNCRFLQSPSGDVTSGSRRKFTDHQQVVNIKNQLMNAKETQLSIVNYKKNGQPFINLLTMIPVFENGAVAYFVGLQIDMVEQPNAIIDNMNGGKYKLSYGVPTFTKAIAPELPQSDLDFFGSNLKAPNFNRTDTPSQSECDWTKMLLENSSDFIHVLSLKGSFLYASPNSEKMFGYSSSELVESSLDKFCHPGDLVSVLRDLREAAISESAVSLLYRFKLAQGGYIWMESTGKINSDLGKGRRCVILSGRPRPVYQLSKELMLSCGGEAIADEYWSKVSSDGLILYTTSSCSNVLGYQTDELIGTSMYQFVHPENIVSLTSSLERASTGNISYFAYQFQGKTGVFLDVNTIIYPGVSCYSGSKRPAFFICRTRLTSSSEITLNTNTSGVDEDVFDSLSPTVTSSWQFELQQLRLQNRKLREEIDDMSPRNRSKRRVAKQNRQCLACMRTSTTEWRRGPEGPSTLCNPCGLKHAKGISPYVHSRQPILPPTPSPSLSSHCSSVTPPVSFTSQHSELH